MRENQFDPSASAFLNALLREWSGWRVTGSAVEIPLPSRRSTLRVALRSMTVAGRHRFAFPALLQSDGGFVRILDFSEMVGLIAGEPAIVGDVEVERFTFRVLESARNVNDIVASRAGDLEALFHAPLDFRQAEQGLLTGHSIHPTPKSRAGFSDEDARAFAPEYAPEFRLRWVAVPRSRLVARTREAELTAARIDALLGNHHLREVPAGHALLPVHPWCAPSGDDLVDLGEAGPAWAPTSSLRTVWAAESPWMLKFSLPVHLTNSVRTLKVAELERALVLGEVLASPLGREFETRYPDFRILREPLYLGLRGDNDRLESLVSFRDNPFGERGAACVLATLLADHPRRAESRLGNDVRALAEREGRAPHEVGVDWFRAFLRVAMEPVLVAQADYGILLSAHQQNLILGLRGGYPERAWFRDCQGTAYTDLSAELPLAKIAGVEENVYSGERAYFFFAYSAIVNAAFGVVASLALDGVVDEAVLFRELRAFLLQLRRRELRDRGCLDYLVEAKTLWSKGNFFCCLRALNETSLADPMDIYHPMENPIAR